jgi:hypothetical protein
VWADVGFDFADHHGSLSAASPADKIFTQKIAADSESGPGKESLAENLTDRRHALFVRLLENRNAGSKTVEEILAGNRADLALGEETRQRNFA